MTHRPVRPSHAAAQSVDDGLQTMALDLWQGGFRHHDPQAVARLLASAPASLVESPCGQLLQAHHAYLSGQHVPAIAMLTPLTDHAEPWISGTAWVLLAGNLLLSGRTGAQDAAEKALAVLPETRTWARATAHNIVGVLALHALQATRARQALLTAADLFTAAGDTGGCAKVWLNLAIAEALLGHLPECLALYDRAIEAGRRTGHLPLVPAYLAAAETHLLLGDDTKADEMVDTALALAEAVGLAFDAAAARFRRCETAIRRGHWERAAQDLDTISQWCEQTGNRFFPWRLHRLRAFAALCRQDVTNADRHWQEAARLSGYVPGAITGPELHGLAVRIAAARGAIAEATRLHQDWLSALEKADAPLWQARALADSAYLHDLTGDADQAEQARQSGQALCPPRVWQALMTEAAAGWGLPRSETGSGLTLTCLDGWSAYRADGSPLFGPLQGIASQRLLAILYLHPEGVDGKTLTRYLYPDRSVSRKALPIQVRRLRDLLVEARSGVTVTRQHGRYQLLGLQRITSDLQAFNASWQQWRSADDAGVRYRAALQMIDHYRAPLGAPFGTAEWLTTPQFETRTRWLQALQGLIEHWLAEGDHCRALTTIERARQIEPGLKVLASLHRHCQDAAGRG